MTADLIVEIEHVAEPVDEAAAWDAVIAILLDEPRAERREEAA